MHLTFDPAKSERNASLRGLPFEWVRQFQFDSALITPDLRQAYPEDRLVALGFIGERLHVLCFIEVADDIRVISLRKANSREVRRYEQNQTEPRDQAFD